jgi:hypothetical protein
MRTVYIDSDYKCHVADDGTRKAVETSFFDGKCDTFVEGYCYDDRKGYLQIYPWKDYAELDAVQREYEKQLLAEYEAALENSVPISELEAAYLEGVNSAYD